MGDQAGQLTFGVGREDHASVAEDGGLAFSVLTHKSDVWGLPIHPGTAEPSGPMTRLTSGEGNYTGQLFQKPATDWPSFLTGPATRTCGLKI